MSGADALVRRIVWCPHVFADLRGQAATELVLFVHDLMCSGVEVKKSAESQLCCGTRFA